ncbi:MAG: M28 family peptidase, partial [Pseudomonadota bacterium]
MRPYLFAFVLLLGGCAASDSLPVADTSAIVHKMPIADTEIAIQALRELSADSYEGRAAMTPGNAAAQAWISSQVAEMNGGIHPREHDFTRTVMRRIQQPEDVSGTNLITTLPGRSPNGPILEVTAHYDHIGMTENGAIFNGADDNASGVGALFAILKSFLEQPPEHEVRIIWLDAEEGGLNGAREYVRTEIDDRPRLNLNL